MPGKTLKLSPVPRPNNVKVTFEPNVFGYVDGGKLWDIMDVIQASDFSEDNFRLLLKAHFDKGHQSIFGNTGTCGFIAENCDTCDISWLYKDAKRFGWENYIRLTNKKVCCPQLGPFFDIKEESFIELMESCPATPMPWPSPNHCEDLTDPNQDIIADPNDCQCFYFCDHQQIHGHECCSPPLVFNPESLTCDFAFNVPDCK